MICPKCDAALSNKATSCVCGWKQGAPERAHIACAFDGCLNEGVHRVRTSGHSWANVCDVHDLALAQKEADDWMRDNGLARRPGELVKDWTARTIASMQARQRQAPPPVRGKACQERTCPITTRALPGKEFCAKHQAMFDANPASVRRLGKITLPGVRQASDYPVPPPRPREPGDDDEEVAA